MRPIVLLVHTDAKLTASLSSALEAAGFAAVIEVEGDAALERARAAPPAALVATVELPGMSGYTLCTKFRRDPLLKSVPVVLTAPRSSGEQLSSHRLLSVRADEYLLEAFSPADLLAALKRHVAVG